MKGTEKKEVILDETKDDFEVLKNDVEQEINNENNLDDLNYVKKAQRGDIDAINYLINKYIAFVKSKARPYFLVGADREDIIQEGLIGLYKAIRDFNEDRTCSFIHFTDICVRGQIISAVKASTRQKHTPLNSYISLNKPVFEDESEITLLDIITNNLESDPETVIIGKEDYFNTERKIFSTLSLLEDEVLSMYLRGQSYQEIADALGKDKKSIDNAIQRIKRKLQKVFRE